MDGEKETLRFRNGSIYFGDTTTINNYPIPNGLGILYYNNTCLYHRVDKRFYFDSTAVLPKKNICVYVEKYIGEFVDGLWNGKGKLYWSDGIIYEGEFLKGMIHGEGMFIYENNKTYIGVWERNKCIFSEYKKK